MPHPLLSLPQLLSITSSPHALDDCSPLSAPFLLAVGLQPGDADLISPHELATHVRRVSCPVIAVADEAHPLAAAFDVRLSDPDELPLLAANIALAPLAAATLVQVLRHTENLDTTSALFVESLAFASLQAGEEFRRWCALPRAPLAAGFNDGPPLLIERADTQLTLRLNRPTRRNALSIEMRDALTEALQLVIADPSIATVKISGEGACFSVGGEVEEFGQRPDAATAHAIRALRSPAHWLSQCADRVEFHLHSACIGAGVELPAFGRRVVAAPSTFFQLPELRFGLIPGAGGCVSIPRRIGRQRTAYMALSMKRISAGTALGWGLIDAIEDRPA